MVEVVKVNKPYLCSDRDRHGTRRFYVRKKGYPKIRIREAFNSPEFWRAYEAAVASFDAPTTVTTKLKPDSLRALCAAYYKVPEFTRLAPSTRRARSGLLEAICLSKTGKGAVRGDLLYRHLEARHVRKIRDEHSRYPEGANGRVKALRGLYAWAIEAERVDNNPATKVPLLPNGSSGFHAWTVAEVQQYQARHPLGTKPRLALDILLFTGVRRSDAVRFGRQMVEDGHLVFTETKGSEHNPKKRSLPILPSLKDSIKACRSGHLTWLVTEFGKPYTPAGFGNWFRRQCDAAGLHHCSAHGLRKLAATLIAEGGGTAHELMSIFCWKTMKEAERYTRTADGNRLAGGAMHLIEDGLGERKRNESVPPAMVVGVPPKRSH